MYIFSSFTCRYGINAILRDLYMNRASGMIENFLRMSNEDFNFLLHLIAPLIAKQDTRLRKSITAKERFVVTLRFLARGESFEDLKYLARISAPSISMIVVEVCTALIKTLSGHIKVRKMKFLIYSIQYNLITKCIRHVIISRYITTWSTFL